MTSDRKEKDAVHKVEAVWNRNAKGQTMKTRPTDRSVISKVKQLMVYTSLSIARLFNLIDHKTTMQPKADVRVMAAIKSILKIPNLCMANNAVF